MNAPAAIRGCFSDFKIIRGRKVCQVIVEVPLEQADAALAALGGVPVAADERWVALARLTNEAAQRPAQEPDKPRREFHSLPYAQQAALRCGDDKFQKFLGVANADQAAIRIRDECKVRSRADIETDPEAKERWVGILKDYDHWSRGYR